MTNTCKPCTDRLQQLVADTDLDNKEVLLLTEPQRIINLDFSATIGGKQVLLHGYRVQYNDTLGPTKGGIRFHKDVDLEEVTELAFLMTLKTSLVGLPYGGAKGGLIVDTKQLSLEDLENVSRAFGRALAPHIGPYRDIPAPDVNTTPEIMSWIREEYESATDTDAPAVITGKSLENGGSEGRSTSTARGAFYILEQKYKDMSKGEIRLAIQGFGNAGATLASLLHNSGYSVVAVSDSSGGVYSESGLDIPALLSFKNEGGRFETYDGKHISNEELLELDVDILAPSALGGVITRENVSKIKAQTIIEVANAPITKEADAVLLKNNVEIIPDILANAGGVIVSYFEWKQNTDKEHWSEEEVNTKLKEIILKAYKEVLDTRDQQNLDLRTASYYLAVRRIIQ